MNSPYARAVAMTETLDSPHIFIKWITGECVEGLATMTREQMIDVLMQHVSVVSFPHNKLFFVYRNPLDRMDYYFVREDTPSILQDLVKTLNVRLFHYKSVAFFPHLHKSLASHYRDTSFNIWRGFQLDNMIGLPQNIIYNCASPFLDYIRYIWCCNDALLTHQVFSWLATLIQHPSRRIGEIILSSGYYAAVNAELIKYFGMNIIGDCYFNYCPSMDMLTNSERTHECLLILVNGTQLKDCEYSAIDARTSLTTVPCIFHIDDIAVHTSNCSHLILNSSIQLRETIRYKNNLLLCCNYPMDTSNLYERFRESSTDKRTLFAIFQYFANYECGSTWM